MKRSYLCMSACLSLVGLTSCSSASTKQIQQEKVVARSQGTIVYLQNEVGTYGSARAAFDALVAQHTFVIVDFYADWCNPCKALGRTLETVIPEFSDIIVLKINTDTFNALANDYSVRGIPRVLFFKDGKIVYDKAGNMSAAVLRNVIKQYI